MACDLDGYPLHAPQPEISEQMSVLPPDPLVVRIAALELENAQLRGLLDRVDYQNPIIQAPDRSILVGADNKRERLSAGWEHLRDIAAPELRTMPARALARGKMVIGVRA